METTISKAPENLEQEATSLVVLAENLDISNSITCIEAKEVIKKIKRNSKQWTDYHTPLAESAHKTWKQSVAVRDRIPQMFTVAIRVLSHGISIYELNEKKKRDALEKKLSDDARLAAAEEAEQSGDKASAESIVSGETFVPPALPLPEKTEVKNLSMRDNWKGRVLNLKETIVAVAKGEAPVTILQINQTTLNGLARSMKEEFKFAGCQAYNEPVPAYREGK